MAKGAWSATTGSTIIVPADEHREFLSVQHTNTTLVALGIGEAAVAGNGMQLIYKGDVLRLFGHAARQDIHAIGNGGTGTYQDLEIEYHPGSYISA